MKSTMAPLLLQPAELSSKFSITSFFYFQKRSHLNNIIAFMFRDLALQFVKPPSAMSLSSTTLFLNKMISIAFMPYKKLWMLLILFSTILGRFGFKSYNPMTRKNTLPKPILLITLTTRLPAWLSMVTSNLQTSSPLLLTSAAFFSTVAEFADLFSIILQTP